MSQPLDITVGTKSLLKKKTLVIPSISSTTSKSACVIPGSVPTQVVGSTPTVSFQEKQILFAAAQKRSEQLPSLIIENLYFSLISDEELEKIAVCRVFDTKDEGPNTLNDPRMGVIDDTKVCATCFKDNIECPGHLGIIDLKYYVYRPLFLDTIIKILKCVCNSCGGLKATEEEIREEGIINYSYDKRLELLAAFCEKKTTCLRTQPEETGIKCAKNPKYLMELSKQVHQIKYEYIIQRVKHEGTRSVQEVKDILDSISPEDARIMGFTGKSKPSDTITRTLAVIPPIARQPAIQDGVVWPNHLTLMYKSIISKIKDIDEARNEDEKNKFMSDLNFMLEHFVDNTGEKKWTQGHAKEYDSIKKIIDRKKGLVRLLMMGKRVNYSARTVLSPDPSLRFDQIRVPKQFAPLLVQTEMVANFNINRLQTLLDAGKITHITRGSGELRGRTQEVKRDKTYLLEIGDTVLRWLQNGDHLILNRQPTLHKYGFMGHEVVLGDQKSTGLPIAITTPYNADFDGDEGNLHAVQSTGSGKGALGLDMTATAELLYLMNVKNCIMDAQTNKPIMAVVYDALSGAMLLTNPNTMIQVDDYMDCINLLTSMDQLVTLDERLRKYNIPRFSGRALFSATLPSDFYYQKGKVLIREGILVNGIIDKNTIGTVSNSIVQYLHKEYGPQRTAEFLTDVPFVINRWLASYGLSIGLDDCTPPPDLQERVNEEIERARRKVSDLGSPFEDPLARKYQERQIIAHLNAAKGWVSQSSIKAIPPENSLNVMALSGAKGNTFNITQIVGLLGQQYLRGERMKETMTDATRCLPYFEPGDLDIEAKGFCVNSFYEGLTPAQAYFHQVAGREGLTDTAITTAEVGDAHRKIVKSLEDFKVSHDGSVRNIKGTVFQFIYGEDGFDPAELIRSKTRTGSRIANFIDLNYTCNRLNVKYGFEPIN